MLAIQKYKNEGKELKKRKEDHGSKVGPEPYFFAMIFIQPPDS